MEGVNNEVHSLTYQLSQGMGNIFDSDDDGESSSGGRICPQLRPLPPEDNRPALIPVGMQPLDPSGANLVSRGDPVRSPLDTSNLPFHTVETLAEYLKNNGLEGVDPSIVKGALNVIHHHLVGIPVKDLSFDALLKMFYLDYRYSRGRLEIANCHQLRDLEAVRGNLFIYGGHVVNSLEVAMIESPHRDFAINRTTLKFMDEDINLKMAELYTRLELYNQIVPNMYRAALPECASLDAMEEQRASYAEALSSYSEGLQMYQYMEMPTKPNVFLSFFTMYMVVKLKLRLYDGRLFEQISQSKHEIIMTSNGRDYVCGHTSPQCPTCHGGLSGHRQRVVGHVFEPKIKKIEGVQVNTRSWRPFTSKGKRKICGYSLRVKEGSVVDFITAISSSMVNRYAAKLVMESPGLVSEVAKYIKMTKEPMLPPLEPYSRAWSFLNGILVDTEFYTYDQLPAKYNNLSTVRLYNTWYFDEIIGKKLTGSPTRGDQCQSDVIRMPRSPDVQFDGYIQNLYCKSCGRSKYTANHDQCFGELAGECSAGVCSDGSLPETHPRWELRCANVGCYKTVAECKCAKPTFYIQNPLQFMQIETTFFDRTIEPQIKAAVMASPTGRRYLTPDEQRDVYMTLVAMLGRTYFKIGEKAVRENKERVSRGEPPIPSDNLNACLAMIGRGGTGKSTLSKILENTLKEYGILDNNASPQFWGAQLLNRDLEFKPIISSEITSDFWPRERFCKATANEPLVVKRKFEPDDVVATPEYQLTLFGNKWDLEEVEGSVARRVLIFLFTKRLNANDVDSQLFLRIMMDIGSWLVKAQLAYKYFVDRISNNGLWSEHGVPAYFRYTRDVIEIRNNCHLAFLRAGFGPNGEFLFHPNAYISEGSYLEAAHHFAKRKGMTFPEWLPENYEAQFEDFKLKYAARGRMVDKHGEPLTDDKYIRGIGYVSDFPELVVEASTMSRDTGRDGAPRSGTVEPETPEIQHLRTIMDRIEQEGLTIPIDLLEKIRSLI